MNSNKLRALIIENGMTQKQFAEKLHMSSKTFYNKVKKGVFGTDEVIKMVELLKIENPIEIFLQIK